MVKNDFQNQFKKDTAFFTFSFMTESTCVPSETLLQTDWGHRSNWGRPSASTALPWFWLATRLALDFFNFLHHLNQTCWDLAGRLLPAVMPAWEVSLHPSYSPYLPKEGTGIRAHWVHGSDTMGIQVPRRLPDPRSRITQYPSNASHRRAVSWTGCKRCSGGSLGRRVWRTGRKRSPFIFLLLC